MYHPYPTGGRSPQPLPPLTPPRPVVTAVKLMYAGAVLSAVELVIGFTTIGSLRNAIVTAANRAHRHLTPGQIHAAEVVSVTFAVVIGLLGVALWIWMARANGKGRSWARVVASVLFALNSLFLLLEIARPHASLGLVFNAATWLIGLGAIMLLWQRDSSAYYQASSGQPRYT